MKTQHLFAILLIALFSISLADSTGADIFGSGANTFDIEFVTIGNPNNPADTDDGDDRNPGTQNFGSVPYSYRIGKFEISEQMIDKANALGGLGITKNNDGPDKPAVSVDWFEAANFVNWLNTSTGGIRAYKIDGNGVFELWTPPDAGYDPNNLFRNKLARYFLPSVDEWYKAAYYDPLLSIYYDYPTGSNSVPDGIDFTGDTNFDAVFRDGSISVQPNDITNVGLLSPYGTAGQGGNVSELEETALDLVNDSRTDAHSVRGGAYSSTVTLLLSSSRVNSFVGARGAAIPIGFRVARTVPEPNTVGVALLGVLASMKLLLRRRR